MITMTSATNVDRSKKQDGDRLSNKIIFGAYPNVLNMVQTIINLMCVGHVILLKSK